MFEAIKQMWDYRRIRRLYFDEYGDPCEQIRSAQNVRQEQNYQQLQQEINFKRVRAAIDQIESKINKTRFPIGYQSIVILANEAIEELNEWETMLVIDTLQKQGYKIIPSTNAQDLMIKV